MVGFPLIELLFGNGGSLFKIFNREASGIAMSILIGLAFIYGGYYYWKSQEVAKSKGK